jgi:hypothetical protein
MEREMNGFAGLGFELCFREAVYLERTTENSCQVFIIKRRKKKRKAFISTYCKRYIEMGVKKNQSALTAQA